MASICIAPRVAPASVGSRLAALAALTVTLALGLMVAVMLTPLHHDTTEIVSWSLAPWQLSFWKHPPLLPWILTATHLALPVGPATVAILTALNIVIGAWAVWRLADLLLPSDRVPTALLLAATMPFVGPMALKLNHNAILISLWPLAILAYVRCLDRPTAGRGALLGLAAAAALLAKYSSVLLLAALALATVAGPAGRRLLGSAAAPVAAAVFVAAVTPHAIWFVDAGGSLIDYALHSAKNTPARAFVMLGEAALLLVPTAGAALAIHRWSPAREGARSEEPAALRFPREALIIAAVPLVLTLALTFSLRLRGATAWTMPLFTLLPILVAAHLPPTSAWLATHHRRLIGMGAGVLVAVVATGGVVAERLGWDKSRAPGAGLAEAVDEAWSSHMAAKPVVAAGDTRIVHALAVYSRFHPPAWPAFDTRRAPWMKAPELLHAPVVALCGDHHRSCLDAARSLLDARGGFHCRLDAKQAWGADTARGGPLAMFLIRAAADTRPLAPAKAGCAAVAPVTAALHSSGPSFDD